MNITFNKKSAKGTNTVLKSFDFDNALTCNESFPIAMAGESENGLWFGIKDPNTIKWFIGKNTKLDDKLATDIDNGDMGLWVNIYYNKYEYGSKRPRMSFKLCPYTEEQVAKQDKKVEAKKVTKDSIPF